MKKLLLSALSLVAMMLLVSGDAMAAKPKKPKVTDPRLLAVMSMSKPAKESQFVARAVRLKTTQRATTGFDVDANGKFWYAMPGNIGKNTPGLTKVHENYVMGPKGSMTLRYFGNGENLCVENTAEGPYLWYSSNGSKYKGQYVHTRTICRFPFEAKAELNGASAGEVYYTGGRYSFPAIDVENDLLAVSMATHGNITFNIYSLSEARALPETEVTMKTIRKGELVGEEEETVKEKVKCRDLRTLDPISTFVVTKPTGDKINKTKDINSHSFRGYDIDKDYVYFVEGNHNNGKLDSEGPSNAYITVFDHNGAVVLERRRISVISDSYLLNTLGITDKGYADVADVKVKGSAIYLAFSCKTSAGDNKGFRTTVVKYGE